MKIKCFSFVAALVLIFGALHVQANQNAQKHNIVDALTTTDSTTHSTVKIHQDKRIDQLLANKKHLSSLDPTMANGFRVQVFSSNVQRTAKNEAFKIEKQIKDQFPDEAVYVNYTSPFWKVRVGDFRTQAEAQRVRAKLKEAFPNLKSEIYIVKEQIIISSK